MEMSTARFGRLTGEQLTETQRQLVAAHFDDEPLPAVSGSVIRHERLFDVWVPLMQFLKDGALIPPADRELVILRTAAQCGCTYSVGRHRRSAAGAGMATEDVDRVLQGPDADGWSDWQRTLLRAVDELCDRHRLSDDRWDALMQRYDDATMLELLFLVGHYQLLAGVINSLAYPAD
jgi:AhpD family alkylhydroperoxidase